MSGISAPRRRWSLYYSTYVFGQQSSKTCLGVLNKTHFFLLPSLESKSNQEAKPFENSYEAFSTQSDWDVLPFIFSIEAGLDLLHFAFCNGMRTWWVTHPISHFRLQREDHGGLGGGPEEGSDMSNRLETRAHRERLNKTGGFNRGKNTERMLSIRKRWRIGEFLVIDLNNLGDYWSWKDLGQPLGRVPSPAIRILCSIRNVVDLRDWACLVLSSGIP